MPIPKPQVQIDGKGKGVRHDVPDSSEDDTLRRSRWNTYARASAFPRLHSEIVTEEWKAQNLQDLDAPWAPHLAADDEEADGMPWILSHKKRKASAMHAHVSLCVVRVRDVELKISCSASSCATLSFP